jgi:predicted N-acetyltransferase YhbS
MPLSARRACDDAAPGTCAFARARDDDRRRSALAALDLPALESIFTALSAFDQTALMTYNYPIRPQAPDDAAAVSTLHEEAFGPGRFARSAYRVREASAGPKVALTAWDGEVLVGAIQLTAVTIGGERGAMLLGPLAVAPGYKGRGAGLRLILSSLAEARQLGARLVVLVGDLPYYARAGFATVPAGQVLLPGPADPARILAAALQPGALTHFNGLIAADNS